MNGKDDLRETKTEAEQIARKVLGRYQILQVLGSGGMGVVYLAEDLELNRLVAVKQLRQDLAGNEKYIARFRSEARAAAQLQSPHIAQVLHSGKEGDDYYLIMEYVKGDNLRRVIEKRGITSLDGFIEIAIQVMEAIKSAHDQNILHRDIKPANIVLGQSGLVKILDFGLARPLEGGEKITLPGAVSGTLLYLPPEKLAGMPEDRRSDIYSAGVTLFELAAGGLPQNFDSPEKKLLEMLKAISSSKQRARRLHRQVAGMVMRSCRKEVGDRYPNADQFLKDLKRAREKSKAGKVAFQFSWIHVGVAVMLISVLVGAWLLRPRHTLMDRAENLLARGSYEVASHLFKKLAQGKEERERALYGLIWCYWNLGDERKATQEFKKFPDSTPIGKALKQEVKIYFDFARGDYEQARRLAEAPPAPKNVHSLSLTLLGNIRFHQGDLDRAIRAYREAREAPAVFSFQKGLPLAGLGRAFQARGDMREALEYYRKAREVYPDNQSITAALALAQAEAGQMNEAMKTVDELFKKKPKSELATYAKEYISQKKQLREPSPSDREKIDRLINDFLPPVDKQRLSGMSGGAG